MVLCSLSTIHTHPVYKGLSSGLNLLTFINYSSLDDIVVGFWGVLISMFFLKFTYKLLMWKLDLFHCCYLAVREGVGEQIKFGYHFIYKNNKTPNK